MHSIVAYFAKYGSCCLSCNRMRMQRAENLKSFKRCAVFFPFVWSSISSDFKLHPCFVLPIHIKCIIYYTICYFSCALILTKCSLEWNTHCIYKNVYFKHINFKILYYDLALKVCLMNPKLDDQEVIDLRINDFKKCTLTM